MEDAYSKDGMQKPSVLPMLYFLGYVYTVIQRNLGTKILYKIYKQRRKPDVFSGTQQEHKLILRLQRAEILTMYCYLHTQLFFKLYTYMQQANQHILFIKLACYQKYQECRCTLFQNYDLNMKSNIFIYFVLHKDLAFSLSPNHFPRW